VTLVDLASLILAGHYQLIQKMISMPMNSTVLTKPPVSSPDHHAEHPAQAQNHPRLLHTQTTATPVPQKVDKMPLQQRC
jgi:hypothetical protein